MTKRIMLSMNETTLKLIRSCEGLGKKDAEICGNIIKSWLAEKSIISTEAKKKLREQSTEMRKFIYNLRE